MKSALLVPVFLMGCQPPEPATPPTEAVLPTRSEVLVVGHRGARGLRPENTLPAFTEAIRIGVDVVELDVALTRDGVLVVVHDPEVDPELCTGADALPSRLYRDLTVAQVRTLDCGSLADPKYPDCPRAPGARVPLLAEVLDLVRDNPPVKVNIEIKTFADARERTHPPQRFAAEVVRLVRDKGLTERTIVQSFDPAPLQEVARLAPELTLAALADRRADMEPMLTATGAKILAPRYTELRAADVGRYHGRGVRVIPWTVNQEAAMRRLLRQGVDGLITDRPDLLLRILR